MKYKLLNKNMIIFIFYIIFVVIGLLSVSVVQPVGGSIFRLIKGTYSVEDAKDTINSALSDELTYHDQLINLNGLKENLLGTLVLKKDDVTVVKAETGSLVETVDLLEETEILSVTRKIQDLKNISEKNGAEFLYCAAPKKELFEKSPSNINNYFKSNYETFLSVLDNLNLPYVDFTEALLQSNMQVAEMFYYTDHHWTTYAGFLATHAICEELNKRYDFDYNKEYVNINNYNITKYSNWFLGSKGKKTGMYFTWNGADDFELIIPKFKTELVEEQPLKNQVRKGVFEDSVLYMENMEKDYYKINTYATYSGGDFRLQIMKNNLNPNGKKILMIRDSFACVVAPFLSLQTGELHICDIRAGDFYVGDKLDVEAYIEYIKPDYVLVLYTGIDNLSDSRYSFFD